MIGFVEQAATAYVEFISSVPRKLLFADLVDGSPSQCMYISHEGTGCGRLCGIYNLNFHITCSLQI